MDYGAVHPDEPTDRRIWVLEERMKANSNDTSRLLRLLEGTENSRGLRDLFNDLSREMKALDKLSDQIETLEEKTVRKDQFDEIIGRLTKLDTRLAELEKDKTINQGIKLGRTALWSLIVGGLTFLALIFGLMLQSTSLLRQIAPQVMP